MKLAFPTDYIVWDLETSGLKVGDGARILEIGAARVVNGAIVERKSWLLNHNIEIPDFITAINGITKEMIDAEGVDPKKAMDEFFSFFPIGNTPHLTHNGIRFDIPFLVDSAALIYPEATFGRLEGLSGKLYASAIDTAVLVKGKKLEMERQWSESFKEYADRVMQIMAKGVKYNVETCCAELDISMEGVTQHRALGDVELTNEIYTRLVTQ